MLLLFMIVLRNSWHKSSHCVNPLLDNNNKKRIQEIKQEVQELLQMSIEIECSNLDHQLTLLGKVKMAVPTSSFQADDWQRENTQKTGAVVLEKGNLFVVNCLLQIRNSRCRKALSMMDEGTTSHPLQPISMPSFAGPSVLHKKITICRVTIWFLERANDGTAGAP